MTHAPDGGPSRAPATDSEPTPHRQTPRSEHAALEEQEARQAEAARAHARHAAELRGELQQAAQKLAAEQAEGAKLREKLARREQRLEEAALQLRRGHAGTGRWFVWGGAV